jgi:hypothetical protein
MIALLVFSFLTAGYFFGQWNWSVYYGSKPRLKTLLFPISATRCEKGQALITLFENENHYSMVMAFLWPIKIIALCCEWFAMVLANAI